MALQAVHFGCAIFSMPLLARCAAEGVGFEPTEPCGSPVFKTGAIDHSATPPNADDAGANAYRSLT
jgi:hypothetical protein